MARTTIREEDITSGAVPTTGIVGTSVFTASGTWTKATREAALGVTIKRVIVEVQGGGGTGRRDSGSSAGRTGGGGGGYARKMLDVSGVTSATITVGGTGGTSIWNDGVNTNVQGAGGSNGASSANVGVGGNGSGGDINIKGGYGVVAQAGGGSSFYGTTGRYNVGGTAVGYGTGGGGGDGSGPETGAPGIVIVTEIAG